MRLVRGGLLLLCLLLLATGSLPAQRSHAYWDANPDSLQQVLAGQRADTARLRTLECTVQWKNVKDKPRATN